jgi:hypothetical protein
MTDVKAVISRVKQKNNPASWRVYYGTGSYGCSVAWGIGAICIILWGITMWYGMNIILFLTLGIPCAGCILATLRYKTNTDAKKSSFLVLMPEGIVQYYASKPEEISWISFPNINSIKLAQQTEINGIDGDISSNTYYWLDVYSNDDNYFQLWIKDCFGDTAWICKTIISAYDYYHRSRVL